jgi:FkbM family methyltransferase
MNIKNLVLRSKACIRGLLGEPREYHNNPWQEKQNDFMRNCFEKHQVTVKAVLHVGGHLGEEYPIYKKAGAKKIVFFEPMPDFFNELTRRLKGHKDVALIQKALGSKNEIREMHVNRGSGESTSFLKPTALYDGYFEAEAVPLEIVTLDSFLPNLKDRQLFNTLVTDTQGFDLEVLKGAKNTLNQIDYVYTEVSKGHYHGEPKLEDFDIFLKPLGFRRVETSMYGSWKGEDQWGDMFYIKGGQDLPSR